MNRLMILLLLGSVPCFLSAQQNQARFTAGPGTKITLATGIVEKVFKLEDDGFLFQAYQVKYKNAEIVVNDLTSLTNYKMGDKITFRVMKSDLTTSNPNLKKMITFNVIKFLPNP